MAVKAYDLKAVNLSIAGIEISQGGGTDGFVEITPPKNFEHVDGVDGESISYRAASKTATFTLTLLESADVNEDLIGLINADLEANDGSGIGDFLLEDLNFGHEFAGRCRLDGYPSAGKQAEAGNWQYEGRIFEFQMDFRPRNPV